MSGEVVPAGELCSNCNAPLHGRFCSECGQRYEKHVHSFHEFASEAFESVTHADSRVWRTLWLLLSKPGFLTREFAEGRRARYLPPFRLYLVLSVVLFLVFALVSHPRVETISYPAADGGILPKKLNDVRVETIPRKPTESKEDHARRVCAGTEFAVPAAWMPRLEEACVKVVADDGHAFAEAMIHNIPRALFVLIPLLALVMKAMYWRHYYVEHLLFFIHNHAFTFVLFTLFLLAMAVTSSAWLITLLVLIVVIYPPIYTYKAMRRVYAQGRWITRAKFSALTLGYLTLLLVLAVVTSLYSLVTL